MTSFRLRILAQTLPFLLLAPAVALAQSPPSRSEASAAMHASANPGAEHFTRQQLDQMLAPIALYPDQLLADVLMAATYPQQVLDADHWLQEPEHKDMKGDALASALEPLPWDPSVKSLVPFPQIVTMMAEHIELTQALGTAFAEEQSEVMARVQALRHLAMRSGKLKSVHHLKVQEEGSEVVITESEPGRIYVPIYNPVVVYGSSWPDHDYPPVYLPPPQGFVAETIEPGLEVSVGYSVVQPLWGWSRTDWRDHRITVERDRYTTISRNAEVPSGNVWIHTGPVTFVSPSEVQRSTRVTTTAQVPAGTVAPAQAAAPRAVATRNGAQPAQNAAGANQPNASGPNATQPAHNATGAAQPNANQPAQNQATTAQPNEAHPGATNPGEHNRATATQPGNATEPGKTGTNAANPAAPKAPSESAAGHERQHPGEAARTHEPARTNEPAHNATGAATPATPAGNAARQEEERNRAAAPQHENAARRPEHPNAPAANEERAREHGAPTAGTSQEQARREHEGNRPNQPQAQAPTPQPAPPHQAEQHALPHEPPAPHQAEQHAPPHQPPAPAQAEQHAPPHQPPAPAQAEQHAPPHQPPAQGSTAPPAAAPPHPQGGPHEPPKPGEEPKKEH